MPVEISGFSFVPCQDICFNATVAQDRCTVADVDAARASDDGSVFDRGKGVGEQGCLLPRS